MSGIPDPFSPAVLMQALGNMPACRRYHVGFSGGIDSTALLLALHQLAPRLGRQITAVHFNHGLQARADDWEEYCRGFCQEHQIELQVQRLALCSKPGCSPETMARDARYAAIGDLLQADGLYLTAHHADDQAETVLLHLLRGSGPAGLVGIPRLRRFSRGWLARPLLDVRRAALQAWLEAQQVHWVNDDSNLDDGMDRNFLRHRIIPQLDQRWPGVVMRLHQAAAHLQQRTEAFRELLGQWPAYQSANGYTLELRGISHCSAILQAEIIRNWIHERGAPSPPRVRLNEFLAQLQSAHSESHAELVWRDWIIRLQHGLLWLHELPTPAACPGLDWGNSEQLDLGDLHGQLCWPGKPGLAPREIRVCGRNQVFTIGGFNSSGRKKIKENMRLKGIPDWLRDAIPLLFIDGELGAIGDWWFSPGFRQLAGSGAGQYRWQVEDPLLKQVQSLCHNCAVDPDASVV